MGLAAALDLPGTRLKGGTIDPWRWLISLMAGTSKGGPGGSGRNKKLLSESELKAIEKESPEGLTAAQIVDIFVSRGVRFSEATLRKYVQLGLLPRSRRVGRKGKHRGSMGLYPIRTVRRVNSVKRLMSDGYTIDEIQENFFRFVDTVDHVKDSIDQFFREIAHLADGPDGQLRRDIENEIEQARASADELLQHMGAITTLTEKLQEDAYRGSGAAESAEDLL